MLLPRPALWSHTTRREAKVRPVGWTTKGGQGRQCGPWASPQGWVGVCKEAQNTARRSMLGGVQQAVLGLAGMDFQ
jgi:hypothetical protein